ncbi:MAG: flagellar M-ring protein FliF [Planctomyces sp.]|nr:flagellar M-ring protein FliF [Planctomyces sp.]
MPVFNALAEQLKQLWGRWTIAQRVGISFAALLSITAVVSTFFWATREEYIAVATDLTPTDAANIVGALEDEQITARVNFSGTTVSVPRGSYTSALAIIHQMDLQSGNSLGSASSAPTGVFPPSNGEIDDQRRRNLEQELARSVMSMNGVRAAKIHLTLPKESVFDDDRLPSTASVIVEMKRGASLNQKMARSIVYTVKQAVPALKAEDITLTDTNGRVYQVDSPGTTTAFDRYEMQAQVEEQYRAKVLDMLNTQFGPGNATAYVSVVLDFTRTTRGAVQFDPEAQVPRKETTEINKSTDVIPDAAGPVGTDPNLQASTTAPAERSSGTESETATTEYEVGRTTEEIITEPGNIIRITASVIVDPAALAPPAAAAAGGAAAAPVTPISQQDIEALVRTAIGIDPERNDEITVVLQPLARVTEEPVVSPPPFNWREYETLIQSGALATASLLALITGFMLLRKMKPVVVAAPQEEPISMSDMQRIRDLSEQAKANPEVVASILEAWLNSAQKDPQPQSSPQSTRSGRAAA